MPVYLKRYSLRVTIHIHEEFLLGARTLTKNRHLLAHSVVDKIGQSLQFSAVLNGRKHSSAFPGNVSKGSAETCSGILRSATQCKRA